MNESPLFSIIMPVYNTAEFLEKAIESVLRQDYEDFELIAVNDGSTDKSPAKLEKYQKKDDRITVIHQENQGISGARNTGIKYSSGHYVYFFDSDDMLKQGALSYVAKQWMEHECDVIGFSMEYIDRSGTVEIPDKYCIKPEHQQPVKGEDYFVRMMREGRYYPVVFLYFFNRGFLIKNQLDFPYGYWHEDDMFILRALCLADNIMTTSKQYYRHREWLGSFMSYQKGLKSVEGCIYAYKLYLQFLDDHDCNLKERTRREITNRSRSLVHQALNILYRIRKENEKNLWIDEYLENQEINKLGLLVKFHSRFPGLFKAVEKLKLLRILRTIGIRV